MKKIQGIEVVPEKYTSDYRQISRKRVAEYGIGDKFHRTVVYSGLGSVVFRGLRLDEILSEIDYHFDLLARSIGGTTVPHEWRLIQSEDPSLTFGLTKLGIEGFKLGADVEIASGHRIDMKDEHNNQLRKALACERQSFYENTGWCVNDSAFPHQFILGSKPTDTPVLVDIDPRVLDYSNYPIALKD